MEYPGTGVVRKVLHQKIKNRVDQGLGYLVESVVKFLPSNETGVQSCLKGCGSSDGVISCLTNKG